MPSKEERARGDLLRMMGWIVAAGVVLVAASLWYVSLFGPLRTATVLATVGGVFISVLLGCGLFALAFYSDKSGHDDRSRDATDRRKP